MSIHSKSRRDARKKKQRPSGADRTGPKLQPLAHLLDGDGKVIGGAGLRGEQWVMVMGGKVITGTDSAGMAIAMLKHVAELRLGGDKGDVVRIERTDGVSGGTRRN